MKDPRKLAGWLGLGTLAAVVLTPPEAYGSGRMLLVVGATFAFLVLAVDGGIPRGYLAGGLAAFALLGAHSLLLSEDPYRSVDFLFTLWAYYGLFGFFYFNPLDMRKPLALTLVLAGTAVAAYGLYQYFYGLEQTYEFVLNSGAEDAVRLPILGQLAAARIYSTFALPGTLWGFLIIAIPLHGMLWREGRVLSNALVAGNVALLLAATFLTQSYGLVAGLGVLVAGWVLTGPAARSAKRVLLYTAPLIPVVAGIYALRASTHNPVSLRLQNWLSAWEIFASHPWGSGLNTYAVLYLQHQQLGANETQFAHNTPIQLVAELGLPVLAASVAALYWLARHRRDLVAIEGPRRWLLLALMVWAVHNLIEIDVYFASVGTIGIALAAAFAWKPGARFHPIGNASANPLVRATVALSVVVLVAAAGIYVSGELFHRSQIEIENRKIEAAEATLELAATINPYDSSIFHEAGQVSLELYHGTHLPHRIDNAMAYFRRAIELSPMKVGPYVGLGLTLSTLDRTEESLDQIRIAERLHPAGEQAYAIRRLIERRHQELASPPEAETPEPEPFRP